MRLVREIAAGMRLPVDEFHCTGVCYGTFTGWVNHRTGATASRSSSAGGCRTWRITRAAHTVVGWTAWSDPARSPPDEGCGTVRQITDRPRFRPSAGL